MVILERNKREWKPLPICTGVAREAVDDRASDVRSRSVVQTVDAVIEGNENQTGQRG